MVDDTDLKIKLVKQMLRKRYFGRRYAETPQILPKIAQHERPTAKKLLKSMANDPRVPVGHYKDKRSTYQLTSEADGKKFIESLGGNPELNGEYDDLRIVQA